MLRMSNIVRKVLSIRDAPAGTSTDLVPIDVEQGIYRKYEIFQIATFYEEDSEVLDRVARHKICEAEDYYFIKGDITLGITGLEQTDTVRYDLLNAIKEFKPAYIITSSKYLNIPGITVLRSPYVNQYEHFLLPEHIGEFVVSEPLVNELMDNGTHYIHEWVAIELHDPNYAVKVCRRHYVNQAKPI